MLIRIPFKKISAGWIPITIFLVFTFISNIINYHGNILFSFQGIYITKEGVDIASIRALRILLMIIAVKILMANTKTEDMINAMGRLLLPLEKAGLPVKDLFHSMGLTIQCFPRLKDAATDAYRESYGKTEINGFSSRVRFISHFLLPIFIKSLQSPELLFDRRETDEK